MWCWSRVARAALPALLLCWSTAARAAFWQATITQGDWQARARAGGLLDLDAVAGLLSRFDETDGSMVTIRHLGGDAGSAWAASLRDMLVAYGIPSRFIEVVPGSGGLDILHVSLVDDR
jgi:hypothetical protein